MCFAAFVSVMQKLMKVKASDKFSFPLSIDLGPYLSPVEACLDAGVRVQVYDLQAILIHKGSSASQGHYGNGLCGITSSYCCFAGCRAMSFLQRSSILMHTSLITSRA